MSFVDIYPAREQPLPGITSEILLADITAALKTIRTKAEILSAAQTDDSFDILATVGAGDIDTRWYPQLKLILVYWK
jgi:UDP-N-acetylmuramate--alanine ligase